MGGEEDCGEAHEQDQAADDGVSVAKSFRNPAVDEETNDGTNIGTVAQASLPGSGNFVPSVGLQLAVLLPPWGKAVEAVDQGKIKAFHSDTGGDQE